MVVGPKVGGIHYAAHAVIPMGVLLGPWCHDWEVHIWALGGRGQEEGELCE